MGTTDYYPTVTRSTTTIPIFGYGYDIKTTGVTWPTNHPTSTVQIPSVQIPYATTYPISQYGVFTEKDWEKLITEFNQTQTVTEDDDYIVAKRKWEKYFGL